MTDSLPDTTHWADPADPADDDWSATGGGPPHATSDGGGARRRSNRSWIGWMLVGLVAIGAAGLVGFLSGRSSESRDDAVVAAPATVEVVRTDLAQTETLAGTLEYGDPIPVFAASAGTLIEKADEGALLERGARIFVVAREPTDVEVAAAAQGVAAAEAQLAAAEAQLQAVLGGATSAELAAAEAAVAQAEATLAALTSPVSDADIAAADAQVGQAQETLDALLAGPSEADIMAAEAAVAAAESALQLAVDRESDAWDALLAAQTAYCSDELGTVDACAESDVPLSDAAREALLVEAGNDDLSQPVEVRLLAALAARFVAADTTYDNAVALVVAAEAAFFTAEEQLALLEAGPDPAAIAATEAALAQAIEFADLLRAGPDAADIDQAEAAVVAAQESLDALISGAGVESAEQASEAVSSAQTALDVAVLQQAELVAGPRVAVLMYGTVPAWRSLALGSDPGDDVAQLETNLVVLGFDPTGEIQIDRFFDEGTGAAVRRWKASLGMEPNEVVELGTVVFAPGPSQVAASVPSATVGSPVGAGAPVAQLTPTAIVETQVEGDSVVDQSTETTLRVQAELPADRRTMLDVGSALVVRLPDGVEVLGVVERMGPPSRTPEPLLGDAAVVEVVVLLDEGVSDVWVGAEVEVAITAELAEDVLAVPVGALLALVEGGYALEVVEADGSTTLVGVDTGMFADGLVEVSGADVEPGMSVVVPR